MNLSARVEAALGVRVRGERPLAGGDLGGATRLDLVGRGPVVVKTGHLVAFEGDMLRAIAGTGVPAPKVWFADADLLVMEYVASDGAPGWLSLAAELARLHTPKDEPFGWSENYAFGSLGIENGRCDGWPEFWAEKRLLPFCDALPCETARRVEALAVRLPEFLPAKPSAALLHGDLWSGNILFREGELAALIDPACYFGDREVDFAMLQVFGNPPPSFFEAAALDAGWRDRLPIYQLWPMLVHWRLFGSAYRGRVESLLSACGT